MGRRRLPPREDCLLPSMKSFGGSRQSRGWRSSRTAKEKHVGGAGHRFAESLGTSNRSATTNGCRISPAKACERRKPRLHHFGHTHSSGESRILDGLQVLTRGAEYGRPHIQRMLDAARRTCGGGCAGRVERLYLRARRCMAAACLQPSIAGGYGSKKFPCLNDGFAAVSLNSAGGGPSAREGTRRSGPWGTKRVYLIS